MKIKQLTSLLLIVGFVFTLGACKKSNDPPPPVDYTGKYRLKSAMGGSTDYSTQLGGLLLTGVTCGVGISPVFQFSGTSTGTTGDLNVICANATTGGVKIGTWTISSTQLAFALTVPTTITLNFSSANITTSNNQAQNIKATLGDALTLALLSTTLGVPAGSITSLVVELERVP